jgi:hypothetical protein
MRRDPVVGSASHTVYLAPTMAQRHPSTSMLRDLFRWTFPPPRHHHPPLHQISNVHPQLPKTLFSMNQTTASVIDASLHARNLASTVDDLVCGSPSNHEVPSWTFTEKDLVIMKRFQERTALTIGNRKTAPTYRDCVGQLAPSVRLHSPSPRSVNFRS